MSMNKYQYETVEVTLENGIAWTLLNRPAKRNAMNPKLHFEMDELLGRMSTDPEVKVVVIGGKGGHFSAGMDLKEFFREQEGNPEAQRKSSEAGHRWRWERLSEYPKPTIAMVEGYCVGGGFTQMIGCDFAIAARNARFALSEVNWGIIPGGLVAKIFADTVLPRHALYHACMGEVFDGAEAERIGLINKAVPAASLRKTVRELAHKLMLKSPNALRATKHAVRHVRSMSVPDAYSYLMAQYLVVGVGDTEDSYNSGIRQFLDEKSFKPAHGPFRLKGARAKTVKKSKPRTAARRK